MYYKIFGLTLATFFLALYFFYIYVKEKIFRKIQWEFYAFTSEDEEDIKLPSKCNLPFYKKRVELLPARDAFPEWVPSSELEPTGRIVIGNRKMRWAEVQRGLMIGYVPEAVIVLSWIVPWKIIRNNL